MYARAMPRLEGFVLDLLVYGMFLLGIFVPASIFDGSIRVTWPIGLAALLLYEPLFLTLRGATIGQRAMNLRVVRASDLGRVSFPRALLRTFMKNMFGAFAVLPFLAVYVTSRHQAFHDLVAETVVVPYDPASARPGWFVPARWPEAPYVMPHPLHRFGAIVTYEVAFAFVMQLAISVLAPHCFPSRPGCSAAENVLGRVLLLAFTFGMVGIFIAGAVGLLWGARRYRIVDERQQRDAGGVGA